MGDTKTTVRKAGFHCIIYEWQLVLRATLLRVEFLFLGKDN